ncbi:MAG: glycoside hydrolase family 9 protein [Bacteroidota bacterium]
MRVFPLIICLLISISLTGQTYPKLVEVLPLNAQTIMVHFDDGEVRHHQLGESRGTEWVIGTPLNTTAASAANAYQIVSSDDPAYQTPLSPTSVNRKSKPTDFAWLCQGWNGTGCVNTDADHAKEHWLYLNLPSPMQNGNSYQLQFPGLTGFAPVSIAFDDKAHRSEAIHVNQLGYDPVAGEKYGYVHHWLGDGGGMDFSSFAGNAFHLVDQDDGSLAFSGSLAFRTAEANQEFAYTNEAPPYGNLLGVEAYECDFSSFQDVGTYRLCVEGIGCSFPFDISSTAYQSPLEFVLNGLYQQRSGIATTAPFTNQPRPAPHNPLLTPGFRGKLVYSSFRHSDMNAGDGEPADKADIDAAILGPLDSWGWYQDAGDWDSYTSHAKVPLLLLWLYEMAPKKFGDLQFNLPEAGNNFPDLLDEAAWQLRFYHRLRQELIDKNYGTGGVGGGRVFGDLWGDAELPDGSTIGSWQDTARQWVCTGEDPFITFKYAGMAAQMAWLLQRDTLIEPQNIDWATEATEAYTWAVQNTRPGDTDEFGLGMSHIRLFAAANLYRLTGQNTYQTDFITHLNLVPASDLMTPMWLFGMAAYAKTEGIHPLDAATLTAVQSKIEAESDFILLDFRDSRASRWAGNFWFPFLNGQPTTPIVEVGIVGHYLFKDSKPAKAKRYLDALFSTADYFLGNNPLNMCWITGLGERSPQEILCLDSWYLGGGQPRQGVVPYGPSRAENGFVGLGPWTHLWAFEYIYPADEDLWPAHERWFEQRVAPPTNEYTVHQNMAPPIFTYGYLYSISADDFVAQTPLPLELLRFEAKALEEAIQLDWQSAEEINFAGFELERSEDGQFFSPIEWIAAGAADGQYQFLDREVKKATRYYYRLKLTDVDGQFQYSVVRTAQLDAATAFSVFPNPSQKEFHLSMQLEQAGDLQIRIRDVHGQLVEEQNRFLPAGPHQLTVSLADRPRGTYFISVYDGERWEAVKVLLID